MNLVWVSTNERFPRDVEEVLCRTVYGRTAIGQRMQVTMTSDYHAWFVAGGYSYNDGEISHWMPLPESPK